MKRGRTGDAKSGEEQPDVSSHLPPEVMEMS